MTKGNKKHASRIKASDKKNLKQKQSFISRIIPRSREDAGRVAIWTVLVIATAGAIPFPHTFSKSVAIPFSTETKDTPDLELGDSKVLQEGSDGSKSVEVKSSLSVWGRLFGQQSLQQKEGTSTVTKEPINKSVANGTRKYQYMLCSDGGHRYFTDTQFNEPQTGFTSKSNDFCKENNQGVKLGLADSLNETVSSPVSTPQSDTYEADKIDREVAKLKWCSQEDKRIGDEYIGKVHKAQSIQGITNEKFNAIVDPAYFKYSGHIGLLRASGCSIANPYPDFTR